MTTKRETMVSVQHVDDLKPDVVEALLRWALSLADTKHTMGMRISEWVNGTPALEAAVGASALTQDELGHARAYFAFLRDFPGAPDALGFENDLEARDVYYNPRVLNDPWESWLEMVAVNVLLDRALSVAVGATENSTFAPMRTRAAKILQEEEYHRVFGDTWLARLAAAGDRRTERLQEAIDRYWPVALAWFGPDDDRIAGTLYQDNVLDATPGEMRGRWLEQVTPLLQRHGMDVPQGEPEWSRWNDAFRDLNP